MDVTRENFDDALALIEDAARQSDFVAIDCELSGLDTGTWRGLSSMDTVS